MCERMLTPCGLLSFPLNSFSIHKRTQCCKIALLLSEQLFSQHLKFVGSEICEFVNLVYGVVTFCNFDVDRGYTR